MYFRVNEGADASKLTVHKHINFNGYQENWFIATVLPWGDPANVNIPMLFDDLRDNKWCWFCGNLNDDISSMKFQNWWAGCFTG